MRCDERSGSSTAFRSQQSLEHGPVRIVRLLVEQKRYALLDRGLGGLTNVAHGRLVAVLSRHRSRLYGRVEPVILALWPRNRRQADAAHKRHSVGTAQHFFDEPPRRRE